MKLFRKSLPPPRFAQIGKIHRHPGLHTPIPGIEGTLIVTMAIHYRPTYLHYAGHCSLSEVYLYIGHFASWIFFRLQLIGTDIVMKRSGIQLLLSTQIAK